MRVRVRLIVLLFAISAAAEFKMAPIDVPLERLEANVRTFLQQHPDDARGHYVLGRIYCIAYATASDTVGPIWDEGEGQLPETPPFVEEFLPVPEDEWAEAVKRLFDASPAPLSEEDRKRVDELIALMEDDNVAEREKAQKDLAAMGGSIVPALQELLAKGTLTAEQRGRVEEVVASVGGPLRGVARLKKAIEAYGQAVKLDPKLSLAQLGLGWCWEKAGDREKAIESYRQAYTTALAEDLARKEWSRCESGWHGSVALEAGEALAELLEDAQDDATKRERASVEAKVVQLRKLSDAGGMWITPIVVPLGGERKLTRLLDPAREVGFDLRGDGVPRRWTWLRPGTGILAWDPRGTGRIESARQLFGHYTWSIPWEHGYEPLALLDDDGNGRVEGPELRGLVLWRDADQDGVSDAGEVLPLRACGVRSLGYDARLDATGPWCPQGAAFDDGRLAPTWDWVPELRRSGDSRP